jgi:hypothetical protein
MSDESGADIENLRTHICLSSNVYCLTGKGVEAFHKAQELSEHLQDELQSNGFWILRKS